ncbi:MAG: EAL domain-containing protein [Phycisphaerales bacterium]|nr:EAL domain-containing protein [Phycisphaerales bacterium]
MLHTFLGETAKLIKSLDLSPQEQRSLERHAATLAQLSNQISQTVGALPGDDASGAVWRNMSQAQRERGQTILLEYCQLLASTPFDPLRVAGLFSPEKWLGSSRDNLDVLLEILPLLRRTCDAAALKITSDDRAILISAMNKRLTLGEQIACLVRRLDSVSLKSAADCLAEASRITDELLSGDLRGVSLLQAITRALVQIFDAPLAGIGFVNPTNQRVHIRAAAGEAVGYYRTIRISLRPGGHQGLGPAAQAVTLNAVVSFDRFHDHPEFEPWQQWADRFGLAGSITAPFRTQQGQSGILAVYLRAGQSLPRGINAFLSRLAGSIAAALDRLQEQRAAQRLHRYEQATEHIRKTLGVASDEVEMYRGLVEALIQRADAIWGCVSRINEDKKTTSLLYCSGKLSKPIEATRPMVDAESPSESLAGKIYRTRQAVVVPDGGCFLEFAAKKADLKQMKARAVAGVPIARRGKAPEAVLFLGAARQNSFSTAILKVLRQLADEVADAVDRQRKLRELQRVRLHDELTNLPNRAHFEKALLDALGARATEDGTLLAIGMLDVVGVAELNDALGHNAGDAIIRAVAQRLTAALRPGDLLARLGGDEFGLLLTLRHESDLSAIINRLSDSLHEPARWESHDIRMAANIGLTLYPKDHSDGKTLLRHADTAMHLAKSSMSAYEIYQPEAGDRVEKIFRVRQDFAGAVNAGELQFFLQPQCDIRSGKAVGVEMLVRWRRGDRWISPADFMPVVERNVELIRLLGRHALRAAGRLQRRLDAANLKLRISLNIGSEHLLHVSFLADLDEALAECSDGFRLTLEITEVSALRNLDVAAQRIVEIRRRGPQVSLDDFGTGHASLLYAASLPVNELKLGQEFIRGILLNPSHAAVAIAVKQYADLSGASLIAEGVETIGQLNYWLRIGGRRIQGYWLARPQPEDDMIAFLQSLKIDQRHLPAIYPVEDMPLLARHIFVAQRLAKLQQSAAAASMDTVELELQTFDQCPITRWIQQRGEFYGHLPSMRRFIQRHRHLHDVLDVNPKAGGLEILTAWNAAFDALICEIDAMRRLQRMPDHAAETYG